MRYMEKHPFLMIIIGVCGISMSAIFVKFSAAPSTVVACCRLLWTVALMTPVVLTGKNVREELRHLPRRTLLLCVASGVFLAVHFAVWFESLHHTSVASSTVIVCTEVIWVALGFCLILGGKIPVKAAVCIALTLAGSVLIAFADSTAGGGHLYGDILALVAAVAVAGYTLIGRVARADTSTTVYTYIVYVVCAAVLVIVAAVQGHSLIGFGFDPWLAGLLLAVFSTIMGHSVFSWCLKYFSPSFVSASKLCEPVVAAYMAAVLLGEVPTVMQVVGGLVVVGGVYLYSRLEAKT